jgi:large subunit ribosomal protein L33
MLTAHPRKSGPASSIAEPITRHPVPAAPRQVPEERRASRSERSSTPFMKGARTVARNELRPIIKLRSTANTGYTYVTRKNRRNDPDRLRLHKFDPLAGRHVEFREER